MSDPYDNFPLARANDFPDPKPKDRRTEMLDLLEALRIVIQGRPQSVSSAQVLAVLGELVSDHSTTAFTQISTTPKGPN
jgi:hypothetical protein